MNTLFSWKIKADWIKDTAFVHGYSSGKRRDISTMFVDADRWCETFAEFYLVDVQKLSLFFFVKAKSIAWCPARLTAPFACMYLTLRWLNYKHHRDGYKSKLGLTPRLCSVPQRVTVTAVEYIGFGWWSGKRPSWEGNASMLASQLLFLSQQNFTSCGSSSAFSCLIFLTEESRILLFYYVGQEMHFSKRKVAFDIASSLILC